MNDHTNKIAIKNGTQFFGGHPLSGRKLFLLAVLLAVVESLAASGCQRTPPTSSVSGNPNAFTNSNSHIRTKNYWQHIGQFNRKTIVGKKKNTIKRVVGPNRQTVDEIIDTGVPTTLVRVTTAPDGSSRMVNVKFKYKEPKRKYGNPVGTMTTKDMTFTFPSKPLPGGKAVEVTYDKKQAALYLDLTDQETLPDELNKIQYENVGGGLRHVTLPDTKTESERNQKNFFQPEVATGLQLSALAIDDSDFAMALHELMGAHMLSLMAEGYIAPYTLRLIYEGKRQDGMLCQAYATLDTDGSLVGLGVHNGIGIKEKYVAFSFLGLIPFNKSEQQKVGAGEFCNVFHPSLRATLGERIFTNQQMSFQEDDLGKITAQHTAEWQHLNLLDRGCGSKTVTIEACDGRVKGTISKTSDRMTVLGPYSNREVNEFECHDLQIRSVERGDFISDEVFTKAIQRPIFGRAPLGAKH